MARAAWGINERGDISGASTPAGSNQPHAVMWTRDGIVDLGTASRSMAEAYGINNKGQVVGNASGGGADQPVLWSARPVCTTDEPSCQRLAK